MSTPLDNRRDKSAAARTAADQAKATVTDLDRRLEQNADRTEQQTQALRNARAEAKRLEGALKIAAKERSRLTKERARAAAKAEKARAKAGVAEARYDKTVLAEIVRREKERDRAEAAAKSAQQAPDRHGSADPAPEHQDAGTETATETAARKTAEAAG